MLKKDIKVGGLYLAKVSTVITTVRVDEIRERTTFNGKDVTCYDVTNLKTGRKTTFRSAAKFRCEAKGPAEKMLKEVLNSRPTEESGGSDQVSEQVQSEDSSEEDEQTPNPTKNTDSTTLLSEGEQRPDPTESVPATQETEVSTPVSTSTAQFTENAIETSSATPLVSKIAASRQGRKVKRTIAGMVPNEEQESILNISITLLAGQVLVIGAGAGTGKTATCKMLEQVLQGVIQYTAFNRPLIDEGRKKFVKAKCNSTHSLAFQPIGRLYQHRLPPNGARLKSEQVAYMLGINPLTVLLRGEGAPGEDGKPTDKQKTLPVGFLAGQVAMAIKRFCQSADLEIHAKHFKYIDGVDKPGECENNNHVKEYLLGFARKMWVDIVDVNGKLPFNHDCYVKIWQLGQGNDRPIIAADVILLDEYQDTAPVFLDVLMRQQHALLIMVGDDNQRIYEWRGAVNAGEYFPDAPRRLLSQSYRFGQAVADVANTVLRTLDEPTQLVMKGLSSIPSRIGEVKEPRCYLFRTNAGAISRVMRALQEGKKPHLVFGSEDAKRQLISFFNAVLDLQAKPPKKTQNVELACFDDWNEVVDYSKTDEGQELRLMVKLITDFGAAEIRDALKNMPPEDEADLVCSTAHRSKGREWDTVKLGPDFPLANKMSDSDRRLLYVAVTRAKLTLDVSECPPFCGGYEQSYAQDRMTKGREAGWVPGLKINYTQKQPTQEEQDQWIESRKNLVESSVSAGIKEDTTARVMETASTTQTELSRESPPVSSQESVPYVDVQPTSVAAEPQGVDISTHSIANVDFTWTQFNGAWCIRGPKGAKLNEKVKVTRKNGSVSMETLKTVVKQYPNNWIYGV